MTIVPVSEPHITERDLEAVNDAARSGWISSAGEYLDRFESAWASYCRRRYGIAVSNGSTALHVAVEAMDLKPGDEVIMPTFTIIACAGAVIQAGGTPVLVDADPVTWTMSIDDVRRRIGPRTRAIMAVHIYGHPCAMDPILSLAAVHGLTVIEDAAEAHGAEYLSRANGVGQWRRCGGFGTVSCFSFYANKLITTGEGGMVLTDDTSLAVKARSLRNLCFQSKQRFLHDRLGYNYRLTNLQAALGVAQIERIEEIIARKRWIAAEYRRRLEGIGRLQLPHEAEWARNVYWMFGVVLDDNVPGDAKWFAARLQERGIETRPFFLGMHRQPALLDRGLFAEECYATADRLSTRGFYLPSGLTLTEAQIDRVCAAVTDVLQ